MAILRDIKRRIKSVKNTKQITRAMKMVSAAKLRRAHEDIVALRPYSNKMRAVVASLSANVTPEASPLLSKASFVEGGEARVELVVLTSDRGLCGGFNSQILRATERFIRERADVKTTLNIAGRRAFDYFKSRPYPVVKMRPFGGGRPSYDLAVEIAADCMDGYLKDRADEVYILYSEFKSALTQRPIIEKLLPIVPPAVKDACEEFLFEPNAEAVLRKLLPKYVEVQVFRALLESSASEHGARMTAMDSASRNATDMIAYLTLQFNRARQATITKELMEIIGGAEALK